MLLKEDDERISLLSKQTIQSTIDKSSKNGNENNYGMKQTFDYSPIQAKYGLDSILDSVQEKEKIMYKRKKRSDIKLPLKINEKIRISSEYVRIFETYLNHKSFHEVKHKFHNKRLRSHIKVNTSLDKTINKESRSALLKSVDLVTTLAKEPLNRSLEVT